MQAATDASLPNPFFLEGSGESGVAVAPVGEPKKAGPPGRPPPPSVATASPAHAPPKSAFDDLNDSIRMALGNSPAKQPLNTSGQPLGATTNPAGNYASTFQASPAKTLMGQIIYMLCQIFIIDGSAAEYANRFEIFEILYLIWCFR